MISITVIIVTYNGMRWIRQCLNALSKSSYPFHCLIIDNCSTDETVRIIRAEYQWVEIIETGENLGFGKANNLGIRHAIDEGCDAVFLLNQDAYVAPDAITEMVSFFDGQSLISPLQYRGDGQELDSSFSKYLQMYAMQYFLDKESMSFRHYYEVDFVNAAAWLIPLSVIKKVGLFDPMFDHYGEDENYAQRVCYKKIPIKVIPSSKVCHDRNQNAQRKIDYRYLKTYMLVSVLNPCVEASDILELRSSYWLKFFLYAIKDFIKGKKQLAFDKFHLVNYFFKNRNNIFYHRNNYMKEGAFL